jgi:hypothetical protein
MKRPVTNQSGGAEIFLGQDLLGLLRSSGEMAGRL